MPLEFNKLSFREIHSTLEQVEKWFLRRGVNVQGSRFETLRKNIEIITDHYEKQRIKEAVTLLGDEVSAASLGESLPYINIYRAFKDRKSHEGIPKRTLEKIIQGSFLSREEDDTTNEARNLLFELDIATLLSEKGLKILSFDDVTFELEGAACNIQCKRPRSLNSIEANAKEALEQIHVKFSKTPKNFEPRGIIALAVDKILEQDQIVIKTPTGTSLEKHVVEKMLHLIHSNRDSWKNVFLDHRILAVFIFLRYVAEVKETGVYSTGKQTIIDSPPMHPTVQARDSYRIRILQGLLKT